MTIFSKLKQAVRFLDEEERAFIKKNVSLHKNPPEVDTEIVIDPLDKLPFFPQREKRVQPLFSKKTLHLEPVKKSPPKPIPASETEHPVSPLSFDSFQDIKNLLRSLNHPVPIYDDLPNDQEAIRRSKLYEKTAHYPFTLLIYDQISPLNLKFLKALERSIELRFGSIQCLSIEDLEKNHQIDSMLKDKNLKLLICLNDLIWHHPKLLSQYRELPGQLFKRLGTKDLLILSQIDYYLKDPGLKRSLWNHLTTYFKSHGL